ncbi:hypothetical protein [Streptosporangium sp. NPDC002524]|uniref:hypothetical protein n=1 Tax=Streptosporangium sp. NPDC002524 TaxID=3154537 RepID=UPI003321D282
MATRLSVRLRATLAATAIVAVALGVASSVLVGVLTGSLTRSASDEAARRAGATADVLAGGTVMLDASAIGTTSAGVPASPAWTIDAPSATVVTVTRARTGAAWHSEPALLDPDIKIFKNPVSPVPTLSGPAPTALPSSGGKATTPPGKTALPSEASKASGISELSGASRPSGGKATAPTGPSGPTGASRPSNGKATAPSGKAAPSSGPPGVPEPSGASEASGPSGVEVAVPPVSAVQGMQGVQGVQGVAGGAALQPAEVARWAPGESFALATMPVDTADGTLFVQARASLEPTADALATLRGLLLPGIPALLLLVAALT